MEYECFSTSFKTISSNPFFYSETLSVHVLCIFSMMDADILENHIISMENMNPAQSGKTMQNTGKNSLKSLKTYYINFFNNRGDIIGNPLSSTYILIWHVFHILSIKHQKTHKNAVAPRKQQFQHVIWIRT